MELWGYTVGVLPLFASRALEVRCRHVASICLKSSGPLQSNRVGWRYLPQELRPLAVKSCRRAGVCLKSSGGMLRALIYKKSGGAL